MKKMLALLTALTLCLSLSSCKKQENGGETTTSETTQTTTEKIITTTCEQEKDVEYKDVNENYVTTENLNVRKGPGTDFEKITLLPRGTRVTVLANGDNGWSRVKLSEGTGYAKTEYLEKEKTESSSSSGENTSEKTAKKTTEKSTEAATSKPVQVTTAVSSNGHKIETRDGLTYVDGILVANKTYSLPEDYNPGGLTGECLSAFNKMSSAASGEGLSIYVASGFRSYDTQRSIYNRYVSNDGKAAADTYSARPGHSEHQTGLAIDLNDISSGFAETDEGKWVAENCYRYGFIIRYPKGKEGKTGYMYEPWHIRYVGVAAATEIYNSGLCLEEYYGITSQY